MSSNALRNSIKSKMLRLAGLLFSPALLLLGLGCGPKAPNGLRSVGARDGPRVRGISRIKRVDLRKNDERTALLIGISRYEERPLSNPVNDVERMRAVLADVGFDVVVKTDLNRRQFKDTVTEFGARLKANGGVGLFFYSGHGVQLDGENYMLPRDFNLGTVADAEDEGVSLARVVNAMEAAKNPLNLIFLDACRDAPISPLTRSSNLTKGLAKPKELPEGFWLAFAAAPGHPALDGEGELSPYTAALAENIPIRGRRIVDVLMQTRRSVKQATEGFQQPWYEFSVDAPFYFREPLGNDIRSSDRLIWSDSNEIGMKILAKEVTVDDYRVCVDDGACQTKHFRSAIEGCNWPAEQRAGHPMNCVNWFGARDFCKWAGGRLPTIDEWLAEATASGARSFPWGEEPVDCSVAVVAEQGGGCGTAETWPPCSRPNGASISEVCDLIGNVWEWTSTSDGDKKVLVGGGWNSRRSSLEVSSRALRHPTLRSRYHGFRCVAPMNLSARPSPL